MEHMEHLLWRKNGRTSFNIWWVFLWLTSASFQLVPGTTWRLWEHSMHCMWWIMCGRLSLASSLFQDGIIIPACCSKFYLKLCWDVSFRKCCAQGGRWAWSECFLNSLNSMNLIVRCDVSFPVVSNPERPVEKIHNTKAQHQRIRVHKTFVTPGDSGCLESGWKSVTLVSSQIASSQAKLRKASLMLGCGTSEGNEKCMIATERQSVRGVKALWRWKAN